MSDDTSEERTATERWFRQLVAYSSELIIVLDERARVRYANPANTQLLGFGLTEEDDRDVFEFIHPDDHVAAATAFAGLLEHGGTSHPFVLRIRTASGEWRFVEIVMTNRLDDSVIAGVLVNGHDVTERTYLVRALRALTEGRKILVNAVDEKQLITDVCENLVASAGILLAWVGYVEHEEAAFVRPVAAAGRREFLNEVNFSWGEYEYARGVIGEVVRTSSVRVIDDVRRSSDLTRWWDQSEKYGLLSACSFPLNVADVTVGTLTIHSDEIGFFGPEQVAMFSDLAAELSYGVARLRDAQRLERSENLLSESEERFRLAFDANLAPMLFSDLLDRVIAVNNAFCRMIGYTREELLGRDCQWFTHPDDMGVTKESRERLMSSDLNQQRYVKRYLHKDGRVVVSEVSRSAARGATGEIIYFVTSERDITEERALAAQLSFQALHDPLTGLANRALFEDRLMQAHSRSQRQGGLNAIFLLDLDDFKVINDTYGHLAGDDLIVSFATRLTMATRASDTLCRFGGDEFLCLAEGLGSADEVEEMAARFLHVLAEPFTVEGKSFEQRSSVGVALWPPSTTDPHEIVRDADVALYEAKRRGKGQVVVFTPNMRAEAVNYFELARELRGSLAANEISLQFQPLVDLTSMAIVGFEATSRWRHPTLGWVAPETMIPLAEQSDLIVEIGALILSEAVAAVSTWPDVAGPAPYVVIRMSARQFLDSGVVARAHDALTHYGVRPERLVIEIAEGVAQRDVAEAANVVERLRQIGVGLAFEGFGTGYLSFSHLIALDPRTVRIGSSLVNPVLDGALSTTLLEAIVGLGKKLGMAVLAEGVETLEKCNQLREMGCDLGQGSFFGPAVLGADVVPLLLRGVDPSRDSLAIERA